MAYVYRHRRLDTNEVFYIGISGSKKPTYDRAFTTNKFHRNHIWNNIKSKTKIQVEILIDNITLEEAQELEILLIKEYGRIDQKTGSLANLTDGGEGVTNPSEHVRKTSALTIIKMNSKRCVNLETGIEYESLKVACGQLGLNYNIAKKRIALKKVTSNFYYCNEPFEKEDMTGYINPGRKIGKKGKPVFYNPTGEKYNSIKEACRQLDLNYGYELDRFKRREAKSPFSSASSVDELEKENARTEKIRRKEKLKQELGYYRGKKVIHIETGNIYPNLRVACEVFGLKESTVRSYIRRGSKNQKFNFIKDDQQ